MTNLLAMPLVAASIITGTNEDWVDSIKYVVDDGSGDTSGMLQLDLTGIEFEMEVRRHAPDHEVVIRAKTSDGTLKIGDPPDVGFLLINIGHEQMKIVREGSYTADIVGSDDLNIRRVVVVDLEVTLGITRP